MQGQNETRRRGVGVQSAKGGRVSKSDFVLFVRGGRGKSRSVFRRGRDGVTGPILGGADFTDEEW